MIAGPDEADFLVDFLGCVIARHPALSVAITLGRPIAFFAERNAERFILFTAEVIDGFRVFVPAAVDPDLACADRSSVVMLPAGFEIHSESSQGSIQALLDTGPIDFDRLNPVVDDPATA